MILVRKYTFKLLNHAAKMLQFMSKDLVFTSVYQGPCRNIADRNAKPFISMTARLILLTSRKVLRVSY